MNMRDAGLEKLHDVLDFCGLRSIPGTERELLIRVNLDLCLQAKFC